MIKIPKWLERIDNVLSQVVDTVATVVLIALLLMAVAFINYEYRKSIVKDAIRELQNQSIK